MIASDRTERPRSLAIQSVVYLNAPAELTRAATAASVAAANASQAGVVGDWHYLVGDSSPHPLLQGELLDTIRQVVEERGGHFAYQFFGENLGHGGGHNRIADSHDAELLLVLNPDGILGPRAIQALAETVSGDVGAADARQLPIEHAKEYDAFTGDTSWASGACLMTQAKAFREVAGFDSSTFFLYGDDVDFSWRVKLAGYRVAHCPSARLFHDKRLTVDADWPATEAELKYSAEAALFLAHKYSREDILTALEKRFSAESSHTKQALGEFHSRRDSGSLPEPLDPDHRVGQFVNGNYAVHRY